MIRYLLDALMILLSPQTEYKYCYDVVLHYVLHYLHKEDEYGRREHR